MTDVEQCIREVLRLQLTKPRNWNWEISTSKSSPHIALPTIQLYNSKGKLLVETSDNGTTEVQKWNSLQRNAAELEGSRRQSQYLQRSRSANLEKKLLNSRGGKPSSLIGKKPQDISESKNIQRCRSDSVAMRPYTKKRKGGNLDLESQPHSNYIRAPNGEIRAQTYDPSYTKRSESKAALLPAHIRNRSKDLEASISQPVQSKYIRAPNGEIRAHTHDSSYTNDSTKASTYIKKPKERTLDLESSIAYPYTPIQSKYTRASNGEIRAQTYDHSYSVPSTTIDSYIRKHKERTNNLESIIQPYSPVESKHTRARNGEIRAQTYDRSYSGTRDGTAIDSLMRKHKEGTKNLESILQAYTPAQSKYTRALNGEIRAVTCDPNYSRFTRPLNYEANTPRNYQLGSERNLKPREAYDLKKSRSDVLDIKVKSKLLQVPAEKQTARPYHRRSRSDDLFQKTKQKYDLRESRKRAENDGYLKFILGESGIQTDDGRDNKNDENDADDKNKRNRLGGYLATAETVICNNKPKNIEITDIAKPKRYVLRQSRAGTLVLEEENFSPHHRRRCHGEFGDCSHDENDVHITDDTLDYTSNRREPQRSKSYRDVQYSSRDPWKHVEPSLRDYSDHYKPTWTSSKSASFRIRQKQPGMENHQLFYSKSDVFPFKQILSCQELVSDSKHQSVVDENANYIVNEPLTTPESDQNKSIVGSTTMDGKRSGKLRRRYDYRAWTLPSSTESETGPIIRNQKTSNRGCDLLQLVRRLSSSKGDEGPISKHNKYQRNTFKTYTEEPSSENPPERRPSTRRKESEDFCDVSHVMGANVSRHSTKGLSGRRSQSSGSICNGKGRQHGDGSGKGSGGSLPSYLDDGGSTSTNNYEDDHRSQLDDNERLPPLGDGAPLHWKFSDGQTSQLQDQGYGSERSPEEEYPPPLPEHDMEQCHHHLEAHSCYPFITPESTFTVKLTKGARGLGLSVTGGIESGGSWPGLVRIKRLFPYQPASTCGLLNVGDLLLEVNGVTITGLTNYEALEVLRTSPNQVELKVCRPPPDVLNCVSPVSEVPPPPPARREPPNSLNLSSNNYYGNSPEDDYFQGEFEVTLTKIQGSLGFTLRKEDESILGHYVRALVREPALTDGRIRAGDRIIAVNDVEIYPMSHEQAVQYLRQCGDQVKLRLYRDAPHTPVSALSPTEDTPRTSFSRKAKLRPEAVDMLNGIAGRKLLPAHQQVAARRSLSPTSSPRSLRRLNHSSDVSQDCGIKYIIPEEQFHEGMLKCKHFDEESFSSLFIVESEDMDRPARPNSLDLYNPNQTPVATRKPKFSFSLAHNAYELNNLDPELLDAPNLKYNLGGEDGNVPEIDSANSYPKEPASMPHIPLDRASTPFCYKNPTYQSAHPPCVDSDGRSSSSASKNSQPTHKEETDTIKRKKGILKKDSSSSKYADKTESKTESERIGPMKEEIEILSIELNRGWNSRLGFSLQGAAGVTYVSAVYADSVAAKDGRIKPGDRIIKVNDENVEHMSTSEIIDLLRIVRGPVCIDVKRIKSTEDCGKSNAEN